MGLQLGSYLVQIEHYLEQRLGEDVAGRLQTGRSRNDQEAAAERLMLRDLLLEVFADLLRLQHELLRLAAEHADTLMPGYTTSSTPSRGASATHDAPRELLERDLQRIAGTYRRRT